MRYKYKLSISFIILLIIAIGCQNEEIVPSACFSITDSDGNEISQVSKGTEVFFTSCSVDAEFEVVYPGDPGHQYMVKDDWEYEEAANDTIWYFGRGLEVGESGMRSYTYDTLGTWTVTWLATSVNDGLEITPRTASKQITVIE